MAGQEAFVATRNRVLVLLGVLALSVASAAQLSAQTVLTFEDFSPCDNTLGNVGVYNGVNFQHQFTCYSFSQPPFNAQSPPNRVYTGTAGAGNTASGTFTFAPTQFSGAYFAGDASVFFTMFNGGVPVATSATMTTMSMPMFLSSGYSGTVDAVRVQGDGVGFVMDNVTFGTSTVPEPTSLALLGTGICALLPVVRSRGRRTRAV